jgi:hypothetical protein
MPLELFPIKSRRSAFSLVEILLAISLFALFSIASFSLALEVIQKDVKIQVENEALLYVEEGLEATRMIRDQNYLSLVNGSYGLSLVDDVWTLGAAPETIDSYYARSILIEDAYRDGSGDLADSGTLDPELKKVTSTVTWMWRNVVPKSISLSSYLSNWSSDEWMQTTCAEFSLGTQNDTTTQAAAAPPVDNCVETLELVEEAGTFFVSTDIGEHGNDVDVEGNYAYVATHKNNEGLAIVDLSDLENPVVDSHTNVGGKGRYILYDSGYVYMGVEKSTGGLVIVDVSSSTSTSVESTTNIGGYGNQATLSGDTLFMGVEDSNDGLVIYDVSDPGAPSLISSLDVGAETNSVAIDGDYAFIGIEDDSEGFKVVDISDTSSPSVVASLDVGDDVQSIWLSGPFAFVGTAETGDSLRVLDISDPLSPSELTSLDVGHKIEDLGVEGNYLYATLDQNDEGLAVINIASPTAPYVAFYIDTGGKGTGVVVDDGNIYAGIDVANNGLVITAAASVSVATSGDYTSAVFDTGSADTRFNFIEWVANVVPGSTVEFQIRTASSSAGLSSATWVGPDGTNASTYDTTPSTITLDPSASGSRYFQFKVFMTSDGFTTPSVDEVLINYNP